MATKTTLLAGAAFLVVFLSAAAEGQRTLMRTCDCEYVTNGKCAYTLLLPIGDAASTCADRPENPDHFPGQSPAETRMLQDQIYALRENLTLLYDWSWSQSKLLAQIQGAIISLQNGVNPVVPPADSTNEPTSGSPGPETDSVMRQVGILSAEVGTLKDTLLSTSGELASVSASVNDLTERVRELNATLEQLKDITSELVKEDVKKIDRMTCSQKGLLVSGDVAAIPDDNITTSSIFNDEHGSVKGRINNTNAPGAWCPKEPNTAYEWIQFDFGRDRLILGTVLKGRYDFTQWVTSYRVEYTTTADPSSWSQVRDVMGDIEIYMGNVDQNTASVNLFFNAVEASAIRIIPRVGNRNANKCLRADVIGCLDDVL